MVDTTGMEFTTPEGYRVRYMFIGPELATTMLDANTRNRSVSTKIHEQYARAMESFGFPFIGNSILFGEEGLVLDGQHRLLAIVASGCTIGTLVVSGLPNSVQKFIDSGRKRTAADELKINGYENGSPSQATANLCLSWKSWRDDQKTVTMGNWELYDYAIARYGHIALGLGYAAALLKMKRRVSKPAIAAAFVRAMEVTDDAQLVQGFFDMLTKETFKQTLGNPIRTLNHSYLHQPKADAVTDLWKIVRTWNAVIAEQSLSKLQMPTNFSRLSIPDMLPPAEEDVSPEREAALAMLERLMVRG